jgi:glutamine amidotransferase
MCRLFGFRSGVERGAHHSLVEAENALLIQSQSHPDGWGLGYYEDGQARVHKGTEPAFRDQAFATLSRSLTSQTVIAHVRQATVGPVSDVNTHPFTWQNWIFAHNGTVFGFSQLRPYFLEEIPAHLRALIRGTTDSEHCFFLFLGELEHLCDLDRPDTTSVEEALTNTLQKVASWCRLVGIRQAPCMNFLISNGTLFIASRLGRDLHYSTRGFSCAPLSSCSDDPWSMLSLPGRVVSHLLVASERTSAEDAWEEVPNNSILLVDEGMRLRLRRDVVSLVNLEFSPMPASLNAPQIGG